MARMGVEFEPDAQFMEESWTLGVAAAAESWRTRRGDVQRERAVREEREQQSRAFREMDSVGAMAFAQASAWYAEVRRAASGAGSVAMAAYGGETPGSAETRGEAAWLQRCAEEPFGGWQERYAEEGSSGAETGMSVGRAMRLLGMTAASTREQVRAAYRRMAGEWHPDRVAGRAEEIRRAATEKMGEINEAYRVLRAAVR